ncbi:MAG: hypothetical protein AUK55_05180 [Syntrophobacteraceae bacterium CG2_30_61_12]|nr:MAG: hypothetical protein AUK55_05180 [Syntrophobacteraceae bacterium CG2_30_61_12]
MEPPLANQSLIETSMIAKLLLRLLGTGLLLVLTACASSLYRQPVQVPPEVFNSAPPTEAQALWAQAEKTAAAGDLMQAIGIWEKIANSYPNNAIAPKSLSRIGRLYLSKDRPDTALRYFNAIIDQFPQWQGTAFAQVDRVEALWGSGSKRNALNEAGKLWESPFPDPEFRVRLSAFLARSTAAEGELPNALNWLDTGFAKAQTEDQKSLLNRSALTILAAMNEATARKLAATAIAPSVRPYLDYRLAQIQLEQGHQDAARDQFLKVLASYPDHPITASIRDLLNQGRVTTQLKSNSDRIGCILPLTGSYAEFGRQVLRGLALAVENWNTANPSSPVTLIVKDSRAQPDQAAAAFRSLAADHGVLAIVGPLSAKCTNAVTADTSKYGVPMLSFTQQEAVEARSPFVFHLLIDNREMVDRLLRYCREQLGATRFAVLHPNDRYGNRLAKVFSSAATAGNVNLVANVAYQPGTTDFKQAIGDLLKQASDNPYSRDNKSAVEVLFIPDQPQTVALIAPQLPYYNIISPTLLGTNLWDDPSLLTSGGVYLENAVFATALPLTDSTQGIARFREQFRDAYGAAPHYLEAQAYDALTLLLTARDRGGNDRATLQNNLLHLSGSGNLTGVTAFRPDGTVQRDYLIYKIQNGVPVQVSP